MANYIARRTIELEQREKRSGKAYYDERFTNKKLLVFKEEIDRILIEEGYEYIISK